MTDEITARHLGYLDGIDRPDPACAWPRRSSGRRWCIYQSEYRREATAEASIRDVGTLVYVPRFHTQRRDRSERKWITVERPLFPTYGFAEADANVGRLSNLRGVRELVMQGDHPAMVSDAVIDQLINDAGNNFGFASSPEPVAAEFSVNDAVKIAAGPFAGFYGIVNAIDAKDRITVFIDFLGGVRSLSGLSGAQLLQV